MVPMRWREFTSSTSCSNIVSSRAMRHSPEKPLLLLALVVSTVARRRCKRRNIEVIRVKSYETNNNKGWMGIIFYYKAVHTVLL